MHTLEELLRNVKGAKDAISPHKIPGPHNTKSVAKARESITALFEKIRSDVDPSGEEEQYISNLNVLCGIPLNETANQLKADILSGVEHPASYYKTEFEKLALFAEAARDAWRQRTSHEPGTIEKVLGRYNFEEASVGEKFAEAKDILHLVAEFKSGATPGMPVINYMLSVQNTLINQPPDWSPLVKYYPDASDWIVSEAGKRETKTKVSGVGRFIGGIVAKTAAKAAISMIIPSASLLLLNPADYIPTGYLSVSEKERMNLEGMRLRGSMGKGDNAELILDCVYVGRVLSHPKFAKRATVDIVSNANNARRNNQFVAECFVANLCDDKDSKFEEFVQDFQNPNYSIYVYDYPRKGNKNTGRFIYNKNDWKTAQFAGWFEPKGNPVQTIDLIGAPDNTAPVSGSKNAYYYKVANLQKSLRLQNESQILKVIRYHYPDAKIKNDTIYFIR